MNVIVPSQDTDRQVQEAAGAARSAAAVLARAPRPLAYGLGGLLALGVLLAVYLRHRQYGFYFHFKLLAFIGPVVLVVAAAGAARLRRAGPPLLAVFALTTAGSVVAELDATGYQLPPATIQLLDRPRPGSSLTWTLELLGDVTAEPDAFWGYEVRTDHAADGYGHTHAHVWRPDGTLVAISRQTVAVFG